MGSDECEEILREIYKDDPPEYVTVKRAKLEEALKRLTSDCEKCEWPDEEDGDYELCPGCWDAAVKILKGVLG